MNIFWVTKKYQKSFENKSLFSVYNRQPLSNTVNILNSITYKDVRNTKLFFNSNKTN